ncbi:CobW/HypB/UreG, nucleotide-binding domain [Musa troglodytarum]|uniref:CobW/HypB/UreG, nucleotide-binding domain n=1 Tax=Musa troglodytarum TaxID=320322 RepID=A0A9E7EFH5_9LILI|nr:CobW/HypB/UreG, nucleotide-binding domain [Musa troglodytarum]
MPLVGRFLASLIHGLLFCLLDVVSRREGSAAAASWVGPDGRVYHSHDGLAPHSHEPIYSPGFFRKRAPPLVDRDFKERAFTVGIGGPVGTGKTALMLALCQFLRDKYSLAAVTNDIFTKEDGEFLVKHGALPEQRIRAVELEAAHLLLYTLWKSYLICIRQTYFFVNLEEVINKTDIAEAVGADLKIMERDALRMRDGGPFVFAQVKHRVGVEEIVNHILQAWEAATGNRRR